MVPLSGVLEAHLTYIGVFVVNFWAFTALCSKETCGKSLKIAEKCGKSL
jgi:hypothetical protein